MKLNNSTKAHQAFRELIGSADTERFAVAALNSECGLISVDVIFMGTVNMCLVHPRDIFRYAITKNAASIIVAHNHPSGNKNASEQDLKITEQLKNAAEIIGIPLNDHLILTKDSYTSMRDEGIF